MKNMNHYGYYLFLGLGDFEHASPVHESLSTPVSLGPEWTSTWDLAEWQKRLDTLLGLGTNTLFIYLMGHKLPYRSDRYPDCVQVDHPNTQSDFFQDLLDLTAKKNIEVIAVFSTTGHARGFTLTHPDMAIWDRAGQPQVDSGIACHHQEGARRYPLEIIDECLTRYHGFAGVILHPPEFLKPCFCNVCQEQYHQIYGQDLLSASDEEAQGFFMETNLSFQKTILEPAVRQRLPQVQLLTFTIPWAFEPHFEQIAPEIDPQTIIVDWDYNLSADRLKLIQGRLKRYQQFGHQLWFMPTSGYGLPTTDDRPKKAEAVLSQVRLCLEAGVKDIIYFMGPVWWPTVDATSWYLHQA